MYAVKPFIFSEAVREFRITRERQANAQRQRGQFDQGSRSSVTGGQQMDGFVRKITELMVESGIDKSAIYSQKTLAELPGFFRPTKEWDVVVVDGPHFSAAIELKSQIGPSFGNNFNNRTEEALGSALDIWTAYREGAFQTFPAPWLGLYPSIGGLSVVAASCGSQGAAFSSISRIPGCFLCQKVRIVLPKDCSRASIQCDMLHHGKSRELRPG